MEGKNKTTGREIFIERTYNAPRELVFKAWSDAESLKRWYAPNGCTIPHCTVDFRVGGVFHHCIDTPMGECWAKGFYKEIITPEKIVFTIAFSDAEGNFTDNPPVGKDPEWPMETTVTVTFEEQDGKTRMTLHQTASEEVGKRTGAYQSWLQMLDNLEKEIK